MHVIIVQFVRFEQVSLLDAMRGTGVYVLWKPGRERGPVRIGETGKEPGALLSRIALHAKKYGVNLDGVLAFADDKEDARLVEGALLWCADDIGVKPPDNEKMNERTLRRVCQDWNKLRVRVSGQDPMKHPSSPSLVGEKVIEFVFDDDEELVFTCPWNTRC